MLVDAVIASEAWRYPGLAALGWIAAPITRARNFLGSVDFSFAGELPKLGVRFLRGSSQLSTIEIQAIEQEIRRDKIHGPRWREDLPLG